MSSPPIPAVRRKQILKVIFISLLLDLVSHLPPSKLLNCDMSRDIQRSQLLINTSRFHSLSFFPFSLSSLNSIAISKHPLPRPHPLPHCSTPFSPPSIPTNAPLPALSTTATMSSFSAVLSAPSSPSFKPSPLPSLGASPIDTAAAQRFSGPWPETSSPSRSG